MDNSHWVDRKYLDHRDVIQRGLDHSAAGQDDLRFPGPLFWLVLAVPMLAYEAVVLGLVIRSGGDESLPDAVILAFAIIAIILSVRKLIRRRRDARV